MDKPIVKNDVLERVRREAIRAISIPKSLRDRYKVIKKSDRIILEAK